MNGERVNGAKNLPLENGPKLFHYFTKSKEEFELKRMRGKADDGLIRKKSEFEEHDINNVYDDRMAVWWRNNDI